MFCCPMQLTKTKKDQDCVGAFGGLEAIDLCLDSYCPRGSIAVSCSLARELGWDVKTAAGTARKRRREMQEGATGRFLFFYDFHESIERTVVNQAVLVGGRHYIIRCTPKNSYHVQKKEIPSCHKCMSLLMYLYVYASLLTIVFT
jgi:hypothetical protein